MEERASHTAPIFASIPNIHAWFRLRQRFLGDEDCVGVGFHERQARERNCDEPISDTGIESQDGSSSFRK
jgi:hypothetical protein